MQPSTLRLVTEASLAAQLTPLQTANVGANLADPVVGQWVTSPWIRANNARTLGSNTSYPMFIPVRFAYTTSTAAINVTTAVAAATATVTLYADDGAGRATTTVVATSNTIDCSGTGTKQGTFTTPPTISAPGVWANISFSNTTVGINWAEVFGPGTGISTSLSNLLTSSPLTFPENANVALFYWVPRIALLRSA